MIQLPPSKSIGARFMVATYFAGTLPADPIFEDNDDLLVIQRALLEVFSDEEPIDYGDSPIDVGASGTALRFVTAVCASSPGADYVITGSPRLMARPMYPLVNLLKEAGAGIETLGVNGEGPYRVKGDNLKGGEFSIRGDQSSQFISAVMLVSPLWEKGLKLYFTTPLVSRPYIEMTARLMQKFGIKVEFNDTMVTVEKGSYSAPKDFSVEADWSAASFFYEACALGAKDIELGHLTPPMESLQGDSVTDEIFQRLGVMSEFTKEGALLKYSGEKPEYLEVDFRDCPDLVLPYAVACLCSEVKFKFTGVAHLRLKESDRIQSLMEEATKLGFKLEASDNEIHWDGEKIEAEANPVIETHDDHRVAMAFAMTALTRGEIRIAHPEVVEKSFIDFWNQIENIGLNCQLEDDIMIVKK